MGLASWTANDKSANLVSNKRRKLTHMHTILKSCIKWYAGSEIWHGKFNFSLISQQIETFVTILYESHGSGSG